MGQLVVAAAGAYIGEAIGLGAAVGWSLGAVIGAKFNPKLKRIGHRIDDLKVDGAEYGQHLPYVTGCIVIPGQLIWASDRIEVANTVNLQGKGGGGIESTDFTYKINILYGLSSNQLLAMRRAWRDGKLVFTRHANSTIQSVFASMGDNDQWDRIQFYSGVSTQLPDATYEAALGTGNVPAHRGMATVMIQGLNLYESGVIPNMTFEVYTVGTAPGVTLFDTLGVMIFERFADGITNFSVFSQSGTPTLPFSYYFSAVKTPYGPGIHCGIPFGAPLTSFSMVVQKTVLTGTNTPDFRDGGVKFCIYRKDPGGIQAAGGGSSASIAMAAVSSGVIFTPRSASDPQGLGRPSFTYQSVVAYLGSSELVVGAWYQLYWERTATNNVRVQIVRLSDNVTVVDQNISGSFSTSSSENKVYFSLGQAVAEKSHHVRFTDLGYAGSRAVVTLGLNFGGVVVPAICQRAGLTTGQINSASLEYVSAPDGSGAIGLATTQTAPASAVLGEILACCGGDAFARGTQIIFRNRQTSLVKTLTFSDLGAVHEGSQTDEPLVIRQPNDAEIPGQLALRYMDFDQDCQPNVVLSDRLLDYRFLETTEIALALQPVFAQSLVGMMLEDRYWSSFKINIETLFDHAELEPSDLIGVTTEEGKVLRCRIVKRTDDGQIMKFELCLDNPFTSIQVSQMASSTSVLNVDVIGRTACEVMDIPILRDVDDYAGYYVAVRGTFTGWLGAELWYAKDVDNDYTQKAVINVAATMGNCTTALGTYVGGNLVDTINSVTVSVNGTLASVNRDDVLDQPETNTLLIGVEVVKFANATLISPGVYRLDHLVRGMKGTMWAVGTHNIGDRVVVLSSTNDGLRRLTVEGSDVGATRVLKAVTFGHKLGATPEQEFLLANAGKQCYAVVDVRAQKNLPSSNDITISWERETRLTKSFTNGSTPLGETTEKYEVDIYFTSFVVANFKRTLSVTGATSVVWTAAQQTTDTGGSASVVRAIVFQIGDYGRGLERRFVSGTLA